MRQHHQQIFNDWFINYASKYFGAPNFAHCSLNGSKEIGPLKELGKVMLSWRSFEIV